VAVGLLGTTWNRRAHFSSPGPVVPRTSGSVANIRDRDRDRLDPNRRAGAVTSALTCCFGGGGVGLNLRLLGLSGLRSHHPGAPGGEADPPRTLLPHHRRADGLIVVPSRGHLTEAGRRGGDGKCEDIGSPLGSAHLQVGLARRVRRASLQQLRHRRLTGVQAARPPTHGRSYTDVWPRARSASF
jgi:hypothetical protein